MVFRSSRFVRKNFENVVLRVSAQKEPSGIRKYIKAIVFAEFGGYRRQRFDKLFLSAEGLKLSQPWDLHVQMIWRNAKIDRDHKYLHL